MELPPIGEKYPYKGFREDQHNVFLPRLPEARKRRPGEASPLRLFLTDVPRRIALRMIHPNSHAQKAFQERQQEIHPKQMQLQVWRSFFQTGESARRSRYGSGTSWAKDQPFTEYLPQYWQTTSPKVLPQGNENRLGQKAPAPMPCLNATVATPP